MSGRETARRSARDAPRLRQGTEETAGSALTLGSATRAFGGRFRLHPVSLRVDAGAVLVVEGPNGSGKSTLLRVAAGLLRPTSGTRHCSGRALYLRPDGGGRRVETVAQAVRFAARASGAGRGTSADGVREALELAGLTDLASRLVSTLSAGERARLTTAVLLVTQPAVACLDEPNSHLDVEGTEAVARAVRRISARGCAVLLAVHDAQPFEGSYDARFSMSGGRLSPKESPG